MSILRRCGSINLWLLRNPLPSSAGWAIGTTLGMHETNVHHNLLEIRSGATKLSLNLPILAVMLGLVLLEPVSPQLSLIHIVHLLLPVLGGVVCISALRLVLPVLLWSDSD
jgi:hypothetical protein